MTGKLHLFLPTTYHNYKFHKDFSKKISNGITGYDMTFHCKHYEINNDKCNRLKGECIPGRRGCVLEGRVALSAELKKRIKELDQQNSDSD